MGNDVIVISDASYCPINKVGAIAWVIIDGDNVEFNGRPVFDENVHIGDLESMALREGVLDSVRFRRKYYNLRTYVITDSVYAFIRLRVKRVGKGKEYIQKHLLKAVPRCLKRYKNYHTKCDKLCKSILEIAREEVE